jgi:hypothetical protein
MDVYERRVQVSDSSIQRNKPSFALQEQGKVTKSLSQYEFVELNP